MYVCMYVFRDVANHAKIRIGNWLPGWAQQRLCDCSMTGLGTVEGIAHDAGDSSDTNKRQLQLSVWLSLSSPCASLCLSSCLPVCQSACLLSFAVVVWSSTFYACLCMHVCVSDCVLLCLPACLPVSAWSRLSTLQFLLFFAVCVCLCLLLLFVCYFSCSIALTLTQLISIVGVRRSRRYYRSRSRCCAAAAAAACLCCCFIAFFC